MVFLFNEYYEIEEYVQKHIFSKYLNLLLHLCRWFFLPYPGRQKHEETPNLVLHTSCFSFSQVLSSPTMHVSILKTTSSYLIRVIFEINMHLNLPYAGITKFEYLTGDAEGLIVGPDLISCLNGDPWCTIGCWIGLAKSEFEFWFAVFKSAPTIKSTGLAEPCPLFFVRWGKTCWFSGDCWVRSGGLIVFNAENRIRYHYKNVSAKDWELYDAALNMKLFDILT